MCGWLSVVWRWLRRPRRATVGPPQVEGTYEAGTGQPILPADEEETGRGGGCGDDGLAELVRRLAERVEALEAAYGVRQEGGEDEALAKGGAAETERTAEEVTRPGAPQGLRGQRARVLMADEIWEGVL